jgi:hypothetical protein
MLVSSLTSLAQHVQVNIKLLDNAIARETSCDSTDTSNQL